MYKNVLKLFMLAFMLSAMPTKATNCEPCKATYDQCIASGKKLDDCVVANGDCIERNNMKGCAAPGGGNPCEQCTSLFDACKKQGTNEDECIKARADCIKNNAEKGCGAAPAPAPVAAAPAVPAPAAPAPAAAASAPGDYGDGPIWNNDDAKTKCPAVCSKRSLTWNGQWNTTVPSQMSVCSCVAAAPTPAPAVAPAPAAGANPCEQCTDMYNKCKASGKAEDACVIERSDCIQRNEGKGCGSTMGGNVCEQCSLNYENCVKQGTNEQECMLTRADCTDNNRAKGCAG